MADIKHNEEFENGQVKISDDVVATIAGLAATEIEGVAGMSGGFTGGIADMLGRKNLSKGVKVQVGDKDASIDLYIIVKYGAKIPDVAWKIQESVKDAIINMTGLKVVEVNIHVQGVELEQEQPSDDEESE
ncbi:Asp23/Gls24 family envelope stress response protein [Clostridium sp. D2Q-11]|uniref:Asp23/Gls24 family envelope stress response protein n=1 Tax=Anaeromonas frigoriresistens TaxID=2683708 RepID=A0A942UVT8_9FIRM|nr:Asp23/Gls24 family envelope stress response protein [Anaeromonas frigoriresistens]MBS4539988.1 Asp23/Gls24 family envelope stress response protein [Anaeromonas frigoriresistens]